MRGRALLFAAVGLTACGAEGSEAPAIVVRDSAGIAIVEFDSEAARLPEWTVVDSPLVAIGELEGEPEYMLESVAHAFRLSDGRIVVADEGPGTLRFYDEDGRHMASVGREGEGPGEFRSMWAVFQAAGDSIHVWDYALRRLSTIGPDARFAHSVTLTAASEVAAPRVVGVLPGGDLLVSAWFGFNEPPGESRLIRDSVPLVRYSAEGLPQDTLGRWPGVETFVFVTETVILGPPAFGRSTTIALAGDDILVADNDRWELTLHDSDTGELRRILRNTRPPRRPSDEDVARYRSAADDPEISPLFQERVRAMPIPETFPAFREVVVGADGSVWVSEYEPFAADEKPTRWLVLEADGPVARAVTPATLDELHGIGDDWVLGLSIDEFGVERVLLLPLRKTTP